MAFVQIIELTTSRFDQFQDLEREWETATEGKRTVRRSVVARDRNDPDRYVVIVFFDSYESAMENSALAETREFSARQAALVDGPMVFHNLDVIEDRS